MKYLSFVVGVLFIAPFIASAQTSGSSSGTASSPSVSSFVSGVPSINSAQVASLSWSVANSGGYSFLIPCAQGMKFKKTDGTVFPCDTPMSSVLTSIDGIDLSVWNFSGLTKSFTARITPKDASGVDYSLARQDIQISVAPVAHPIESVTGGTTSKSSAHYTLSWTGPLIEGVNLTISCAPTIKTISSTYTSGALPCGSQLFPSGLPSSGSIDLVFDNSAISASDITLTLTPMMAPGVYNGIQTESVTVSVDTNILPDAVTTYFAASSTPDRTPQGTPVKFSWTTENSMGANMRLSCNEHIATTIVTSTASSTPLCGAPVFGTPLPVTGSGTITFSNDSFASEPITLTLMPVRSDGGLDATRGKDITLRILPKGVPVIVPMDTPSPTTVVTPTTTIVPGCTGSIKFSPTTGQKCENYAIPTTSQISNPAGKVIFTKNLVRGSYGTEVRALQEFLKKDHSIYPEGAVTGTFGPATERAVKRFQIKYKLGNTKTPGLGGVGIKTREILNSLVK